ncbi:uncharacterized protein DUF3307 [Gelidibacter algens]|uniref:Uncharacterized protein DUF3307 n=1 Tax=Gelidibacter algens TaxID=49280 RepID=A0A1A7QX64_9FLAO|nr:DUF3307 domain-containing protein [Gelidibacter algens]OBX24600.1 hypothetical protein A9996_14315 [Gelidibacter algens]RAJ27793.1 uncharacterized protein DUF3307 [Gelidibacter algens]
MILIKLILAHLIGDFFLQPTSWVKEKEKRKLRSPKLYLHVLIHIALLFIILWDLSQWPIILIVGLSHFAIDALKLILQNKKTKRLLFFLDQLFHLLVIVAVYWIFIANDVSLGSIFTDSTLILLTAILFLTLPVSIIMKSIFLKWNISKLTEGNESLKDAGKYIGILERILVFVFVILDHWEAVGFLITAKSVFRFGDLKESKERKLTEYILIGTLISFGIAILIGLLYLIGIR